MSKLWHTYSSNRKYVFYTCYGVIYNLFLLCCLPVILRYTQSLRQWACGYDLFLPQMSTFWSKHVVFAKHIKTFMTGNLWKITLTLPAWETFSALITRIMLMIWKLREYDSNKVNKALEINNYNFWSFGST